MPNWCYTEIEIIHEDEKKLKALYNKIEKWKSKPYNNENRDWLANIVVNAKLGTIDTGKDTDIRCRGSIVESFLVDSNHLAISTETAWRPMMQIWRKFIDKYLPDAQLYYWAEESGMGIFYTNKPTETNHYFVSDDTGTLDAFCTDEAFLIKELKKLLNSRKESIDELLEELEDSKYSEDIRIYKWEFVDIDELD